MKTFGFLSSFSSSSPLQLEVHSEIPHKRLPLRLGSGTPSPVLGRDEELQAPFLGACLCSVPSPPSSLPGCPAPTVLYPSPIWVLSLPPFPTPGRKGAGTGWCGGPGLEQQGEVVTTAACRLVIGPQHAPRVGLPVSVSKALSA